jgi:hypothetical protein
MNTASQFAPPYPALRDEVSREIHRQQMLAQEEKVPTKSDRHHKAAVDVHGILRDVDPHDERSCQLLAQTLRAVRATIA